MEPSDSEAIFEELSLRKIVDEHQNIAYYDKNNLPHRNFGPAVISRGGIRMWYRHGQRHRIDGPAIEWINRGKTFYLYGRICRTEEAYWEEVKRINQVNS